MFSFLLTEPILRAATESLARDRVDADVSSLLARGRSQYLAGDPEEARRTFQLVLEAAPGEATAEKFLERIRQDYRTAGVLEREDSRADLLQDVQRGWIRRDAVAGPASSVTGNARTATWVDEKLDQIKVPSISFTKVDLARVIGALSAMAEEYDSSATPQRGVNLVLIDPQGNSPQITLTVKNLTLRRVLDIVTASAGYHYDVQADAVLIRPGGETGTLDTVIFPLSRASVLRMTGFALPDARTSARAPAAPVSLPEAGSVREGALMKIFLQQAGIPFDSVQGSALAYDGSALIITHTPKNLQRVRNIFTRYSDVRQVEIEAKFMEVQEGALEELGVSWAINQNPGSRLAASAQSQNRSLVGAFSNSVTNQQGRIVRPATPDTVTGTDGNGAPIFSPGLEGIDLPIINNAPRIPGMVDLASSAAPLLSLAGLVGEFDVNAIVRALSQKQGTDLLSAPKVTVLSGNPATMTVAQEMRYPQSFGQTQSQVGTGNASGGGSAGVAITAGTPQEFATRNIGVELKVTPTVEEDGRSISLDLNPRVTEFDGFVEYGGPSVAISGSTTVTVPSGFYQPIFSVRDISTKVTIWDGATLVMGGLTREEVKQVNDKVPVLGDIPFLGRLFRSKGVSAQKRNLMIFVTATLVTPGGLPKSLPPPHKERIKPSAPSEIK